MHNKRDASNPDERESNRKRAILLGHDMRNAISDIVSGLQLADLNKLDERSRLHIRAVESASRQLSRLSDEIIALTTGDTDAVEKSPAVLQLVPFLQELAGRWPHLSPGRVGVTLQIGADIPQYIASPRRELERALANLIGNSVKHTKSGEVRLGVMLDPRETLKITIRDTGPGFSDAALARLFEEGGRPPETLAPGTGMGLHIVRDLVARIGGRLDVANVPAGGASVSVLLPRAAWAPGVQTYDDTTSLPDLSGKHVLVAEDNQTNQLLICQMLETLGATHAAAADGHEALAKLGAAKFDIALVDIEMPRLSGLDVIAAQRKIEKDHAHPPLPVLAVTAFVLSASRAQIYEAGADGILAKPIMSLEAFGEAIKMVLDKQSAMTPDYPTGADQQPVDAVHLDRLLALAGEANGQELVRRLRDDFSSVHNGLSEALETTDMGKMRAHTHVLISLAGALGAEKLQTCAEKLNDAAHAGDTEFFAENGGFAVEAVARVLANLAAEYSERFEGAAQ